MFATQLRRRFVGVISAIAAVLLVVPLATVSGEAPATAADRRNFDPAYIISDYAFYNGAAMTEAEIQAFLELRSGGCRNSNCLAVYRQTTQTREATPRCSRYEGAVDEPASRIIFKVQQACNISAKVLLVTLQKEQSLVTAKQPSDGTIRIAMGYGCPDTAACDALYFGFANQVYSAASQFQRYRTSTGFRHAAGRTTDVYLHPNSFIPNPPTCGTMRLTIRNNATAGLYNYTPYTPNDAAMANLYGTGDACSSYGNRNFWRFYWDWFGSPTTLVPPGVATTTVSGVDRYVTASTIARTAYPSGAQTVYVAVGTAFADGLAAAPVAASIGAPLLLTAKDHVPAPTVEAIRQLGATQIVLLGGPLVVDAAVENQLRGLAPNFQRIAGETRYDTALMLAASGFSEGADTAYLATGENFPDALAASAAAGANGAPVLLVRPSDTVVPANVEALIQQLGVSRIVVMGVEGVVSRGLENDARTIPGVTEVVRFGGATRYDTALALNRSEFPTATRAFVASGTSFPDAMAAAAVAGAQGAPIVLSNGECILAGALQHKVDAGVTNVSILGGPLVMRSTVREYLSCG